ncbi:PAS domain S-box protein, partial [candidate division KSB3 bacterium]|nr:PAS domain S-box protein [candidate division KSB3 bacterium]MBD3323576.1 PAS domain S-box protein [candidate division KSB3 bacterium]
MNREAIFLKRLLAVIAGSGIVLGLVLISSSNYLLFHTLAEGFSIVIAYAMFLIVWNSRKFLPNQYLQYLGLAYLFIASLDVLHTLSYKGMRIFADESANLPTQLWIAARYLESVSLLLAPLWVKRKFNLPLVVGGYTGVFVLLVVAIFSGNFPDCFVDNVGLTSFKILSENLIVLLLAASMVGLWRQRDAFDSTLLTMLMGAILLTIGAEIAFMFYVSVYGLSNLVGHLLKILSFYLIYRAIIKIGLEDPYRLLFRELQQQQTALRHEQIHLERHVQERTAELSRLNQELQQEIAKHHVTEKALQQSEERYRLLAENIEEVFWLMQPTPVERVLYVNPAYQTIWKRSPEELYRNPRLWIEDIHEEDRDQVQQTFIKFLQGENDYQVEYRLRRPDGSIRWIFDQGFPVRDDAGTLVYVAGIAQDMTERKQIEQELRMKDDAIASAISGIAFGDLDGRLTYVNRSFLEMWGYDDPQEVVGRFSVEFWQMEARAQGVIAALQRRENWLGELVAKRKDGSVFAVQLAASMVVNAEDRP